MNEKDKANMLERLKKDISVNFKVGDDSVLSGFIDDYISIASDNSNRRKDDKNYIRMFIKLLRQHIKDEGTREARAQLRVANQLLILI